MTDNSTSLTPQPSASLRQYLFNPFYKIAGYKALFLGLVILIATAIIGSHGSTHFDGVLDTHIGKRVYTWLFVAECLINWLSMFVILSISALIVSRSRWRFIDLAGTQVFSRWPTLITALVMLPSANRRFSQYLMSQINNSVPPETTAPGDAAVFYVCAFVAILMTIWMVALMYKSYTVSCNLKGPRAIVTFIVSILLAEVLSKVIIIGLFSNALNTNMALGCLVHNPNQSPAPTYQFQNDPCLIGTWQSVDFVTNIEDFQPTTQRFPHDRLFLHQVIFNENGHAAMSTENGTSAGEKIWTKDWIYTPDQTHRAQYQIKSIDGQDYLFYPWLSGDVTILNMDPSYYVLRKTTSPTE